MSLLPIAELTPELPGRESKQFKAAVTLVWPYSSSQRQFALLLAEPDLRLRRRKGQVRVRFHGSSAKALATTGVGIGDEVIVSLRGAQFVQEDTVSTPGRGIDWELEYRQTAAVQVFRDGNQIANLELDNVAPTPANRSPVRAMPSMAPIPATQWSSPAFVKRVRLSDGPVFDAPYDPLADANGDEHDRKRRRRSYRDWKAWTYNARTPSPDKQDEDFEGGLDDIEASPIRQTQLPDTPVSPPKPAPETESTNDDEAKARSRRTSPRKRKHDDFVRDEAYYDLYAGPDEQPPSEAPYAFGGDTEVNTDDDEDMPDTEGKSPSSTEADVEDLGERHVQTHHGSQDLPAEPRVMEVPGSSTEEDTSDHIEMQFPEASSEQPPLQPQFTMIEVTEDGATTPVTVMPPPVLSALDTNVQAPYRSGLLTPIGREPDSPTLQPLDSATLPLPSPFPGDRDAEASSYLDYVPNSELFVETIDVDEPEFELPRDADYIMETSFFSSIGSSRAPSHHPNHETAFTPVRFTFGMDGVGWSRPLQISSPAPEERTKDDVSQVENIEATVASILPSESIIHSPPQEREPEPVPSSPVHHVEDMVEKERSSIASTGSPAEALTGSTQDMPVAEDEVVELSSGSEDEEEQSETNEGNEEEVVSGSDEGHSSDPIEPEGAMDAEPASESIEVESASDHGAPEEDHIQTTSEAVTQEMSQKSAVISETLSEVLAEELNADPVVPETPQIYVESEDTSQPTPFAQVPSAEELEALLDHVSSPPPLTPAQEEVHPGLEAMDVDERTTPVQEPMLAMQYQASQIEDHHPDIKLESVEVDVLGRTQSVAAEAVEEVQETAEAQSSDKMLIDIPDEHDHMGELHTIAVPATAPARNTRSHTKISMSPPPQEEVESIRRATRSTRSKASAASITRTTQSPPAMRTRSTISPPADTMRTSPYSLRSQSKLLSPTASASTPIPSPRGNRHKHRPQRSVESVGNISVARTEEEHAPGDRFLEAWDAFTNFSDSAVPEEEAADEETPKPPPSIARGLRSRSTSKTEPNGNQAQPATPRSSRSKPEFPPLKQIPSSPSQQRLRSSGAVNPAERATPSPRALRKTRRHAYGGSVEPSEEAKDSLEHAEGEGSVVQTSPPRRNLRSNKNNSLADSNQPLTPNATQTTDEDSQISVSAAQQQPQILPMTPQLTQITSSLRSFEAPREAEATCGKAASQSPKLTKTTPRRNATQADIVSGSSTPKQRSPSAHAEQKPTTTTTETTIPTPTVGLSTPLAFYTPLASLSHFVNRSSQLHTASNPDILALVTQPTTQPTRATKGPKHWHTTLHVSDASSYPASTTVQCFRLHENALPIAEVGDVILLRGFTVKHLNRMPMLRSDDDSAWCVWRYGKPSWSKKRGAFGEVRAREEVKGPEVERGEGEWSEVEVIREWFVDKVKGELEKKEEVRVKTRSRDKAKAKVESEKTEEGKVDEEVVEEKPTRVTRSRDKGKAKASSEE